jgi:hypothetical protein
MPLKSAPTDPSDPAPRVFWELILEFTNMLTIKALISDAQLAIAGRLGTLALAGTFALSAQAGSGPQGTIVAAILTNNGHYVTAIGGGGLGGANTGTTAVPLHTDATSAGSWETFTIVWLDQSHSKFALQTLDGYYLSAVGGGGVGGPNNSTSPIHTDATAVGAWERMEISFLPNNQATIRLPNGDYLTAVNGGGMGTPSSAAILTNGTSLGPDETFGIAWLDQYSGLQLHCASCGPSGSAPALYQMQAGGPIYIPGAYGAFGAAIISPDQMITLSGANFFSNVTQPNGIPNSGTVNWGTTAQSVMSGNWSDTVITTAVPPTLIGGPIDLTVVTTANVASNAMPVIISYPPIINAIVDSTTGQPVASVVPGEKINILGNHLLSADDNYTPPGASNNNGQINYFGIGYACCSNLPASGTWTNNEIFDYVVPSSVPIGSVVSVQVMNSIGQSSGSFPLQLTAPLQPGSLTITADFTFNGEEFVDTNENPPANCSGEDPGSVTFSGTLLLATMNGTGATQFGSASSSAGSYFTVPVATPSILCIAPPPSSSRPPSSYSYWTANGVAQNLAPGIWQISASRNGQTVTCSATVLSGTSEFDRLSAVPNVASTSCN